MAKGYKYYWYNNGVKELQIPQGCTNIPEGFIKGRLPRSQECIEKAANTKRNRSPEAKLREKELKGPKISVAYAKKTDEEKALIAKRRSITYQNKSEEEKEQFRKNCSIGSMGKNKGNVSWCKGLTKETDPRMQERSETRKIKAKEWVESKDSEYFQNWRSQMRETMRENNSYLTSKPEEKLYEELKLEYGENNVKRNYNQDPRYPFYCDFYIPSKDLFIELNKHPSHGPHPFDPNNEEDQKLLAEWEEKAKTSKYYKVSIDVWTKRDVNKLNTAKKNNLNYITIY